jgi:hypothetical protein
VEGAGAKAARIPLRNVGAVSESLPIPADASGAHHPDPQATTELTPDPPRLKGYEKSAEASRDPEIQRGKRKAARRRGNHLGAGLPGMKPRAPQSPPCSFFLRFYL